MSSTAMAIAGLVRDKIATISGCTAAVVDLVPDYTLQQVSALTIVVCPAGLTQTNADAATRSARDTTVKISVAVMDRCEKAELPAKLALTETIADTLCRSVLTGTDISGMVLTVDHDPLYGAEEFRQTKVFIASLNVTVQVLI